MDKILLEKLFLLVLGEAQPVTSLDSDETVVISSTGEPESQPLTSGAKRKAAESNDGDSEGKRKRIDSQPEGTFYILWHRTVTDGGRDTSTEAFLTESGILIDFVVGREN